MQAEWATRPTAARGLVAEISTHTGPKDANAADAVDASATSTAPRGSLASFARPSAASTDPASLRVAVNAPPDLALADLHNGTCGLLYAPLQLHLERRKRTQLALLQFEEGALRREFNDKFERARKAKRECADKVADRLARVADVQRTLEASEMPKYDVDDAADDVDHALDVTDNEISVPRWLSPADRYAHVDRHTLSSACQREHAWSCFSTSTQPADPVQARILVARAAAWPLHVYTFAATGLHMSRMCRAKRAQEERRAEAAREAGERDGAKGRALAAMMDGTLARKKATTADVLPREPWMSVPVRDMTAAQRQQMKEFERKVAELQAAEEAARRAAEGERKAAEEEVCAAIATFNSTVSALQMERVCADAAVAVAEQQRFSVAGALLQVRTAVYMCCVLSWPRSERLNICDTAVLSSGDVASCPSLQSSCEPVACVSSSLPTLIWMPVHRCFTYAYST